MEPQTQRERYVFLDWLRVIAIAGVLFYHVGMMFVPWGWHVKNAITTPSLEPVMDIMHRLRMPLLFVVAGAVACYSLRSRGQLAFIRERATRLLIPLVFGMFVLVPPQVFCERIVNGQWQGTFWDFYRERVLQFQPYPQGNFSWHHLWFIVYLLVMAIVFSPLLKRLCSWSLQAGKLKADYWMITYALVPGTAEALLRPHFHETHALINDWYLLALYSSLFVGGALLAATPDAYAWLMQKRRALLGVFVGLLPVIIALKHIWWPDWLDAYMANLFTWLFILTAIAYGYRYCTGGGKVFEYLREAAYPFYLLHQTVIIVLAMWILPQSWSIAVKFAVSFVAAGSASLLVYELAVRRFALMRWLFGLPTAGAKKLSPAAELTT